MDRGDCPLVYGASYYIRELVALMENEITKDTFDRQVELLDNYVATSPCGILITDLYYVIECMERLMNRINCIVVYTECMEKILLLSQYAPVLTKTSDVVTFAIVLENYFTSLASTLATLKHETIRDLVVVALHELMSKSYKERWRTPLEVRLKAVENSQLPEILTLLLMPSDDKLYPKILNLIHLLGIKSEESCKKVLLQDALNTISTRFNPEWTSRHLHTDNVSNESEVFILNIVSHFNDAYPVLCILIDCLHKNPELVKSLKPISRLSLWTLQDILNNFSCHYNKAVERNAILCFIFQLLQHFPKLDFVSSGLAEKISTIFIFSSEVLKKKTTVTLKLTSSEEDYIYLKLAFACLPFYLQFPEGIRILENMGIMYSILKIIYNNKVLLWPTEYSCEINLAAWDILRKITPHLEGEFLEDGGANILLNFIKHQDVTKENLITLDKCLNTLYHILKEESKDLILKSVIYNDGLMIILELTEYLIVKITHDSLVHKCLQQCFCLLDKLNPYNQDCFPCILCIFQNYMTKVLNPAENETVYDNRTLVCLIDLIWEGVIHSKEFSTDFVKQNCVYLLLDVLQDCPLFAQINMLGLITDLLEENECVPYLMTWRGHKQICFISLLMEIFRNENKLLMVKVQPEGQLADVKNPLMGKAQWIQTYCNTSIPKGSPAIAELVISCRPKIYAILNLLNTRHQVQVQIVQEHYKYIEKLPSKDQVTKLLAENFLAFKLGEVWVELNMEFKELAFTPNPLDRKVVSSLIERFCKWALHLKNVQNAILKDEFRANINDETDLYITLNKARLEEALDALAELKYIARCTERMFRLTQKYEINTQIDKHRKCTKFRKTHSTYMNEIRVTAVFNQIVSLKYGPKAVKETKSEPELVSPIEPIERYRNIADTLGGSCNQDDM